MKPSRVILVCQIALLLQISAGQADDSIKISNRTGSQVTVWFWPHSKGEWVRPPLVLEPGRRVNAKLSSPGSYYIVARDLNGQNILEDTINLHEIVRIDPNAEFVVNAKQIQKEVEQTYTVYVPHTEARQGTRTVCKNVVVNNRLTRVCEEQPYDYRVLVEKPETRTKTIKVTRSIPTFDVLSSGRPGSQSVNSFFWTSILRSLKANYDGPVPPDIIQILQSDLPLDDEHCATLNDFLRERTGLTCDVTIKSSQTTGQEGAIVRYQQPQKPTGRFDEKTSATQSLDWGIYYFWLERNGSQSTRYRERFQIYGGQRSIELEEEHVE